MQLEYDLEAHADATTEAGYVVMARGGEGSPLRELSVFFLRPTLGSAGNTQQTGDSLG